MYSGGASSNPYGANPVFGIIFDKLILYPSPYIVVTETGYIKHYYAGTEKIATQIGDGGLMTQEGKLESKHQERIKEGFYDSFRTEYFKCDITTNTDIEDNKLGEVQYQCKCFEQADIKLLSLNPMLEPVMNKWRNGSKNNNEVYYTHANHLGSASWITDKKAMKKIFNKNADAIADMPALLLVLADIVLKEKIYSIAFLIFFVIFCLLAYVGQIAVFMQKITGKESLIIGLGLSIALLTLYLCSYFVANSDSMLWSLCAYIILAGYYCYVLIIRRGENWVSTRYVLIYVLTMLSV